MSKRHGLAILAVAAAALVGYGAGRWQASSGAERLRRSLAQSDVIVRAIDGDTVELKHVGLCRIMGVDTPEIWTKRGAEWVPVAAPEPGAVESAEWMRSLEGRAVRVQYGKRRTDRYGRTLAHLYLLPDGPDVACELLRRGWGLVMAIPPDLGRYDDWKRAAASAPSRGE